MESSYFGEIEMMHDHLETRKGEVSPNSQKFVN